MDVHLNIHPLFVHFPITLLTMYSVFELLRFRKLLAQSAWFYIKATFVVIGSLSTFLAIPTGDLAQHYIHDPARKMIIERHELFATLTTILFLILAVSYILEVVERIWGEKIQQKNIQIWGKLFAVKKTIFRGWVLFVLALIGLCLISTTGALGGAIAYGPNSDPISHFIYHIIVGTP